MKHLKFGLFAVFTFAMLACTMVNGALDESVVMKITTHEDFKAKYGTQDYLTGLFFYRSSSDNSATFEYLANELGNNNKQFFKMSVVDCDEFDDPETINVCQEEYKGSLPQILFIEPPAQAINPYTKKPMQPVEHGYQGEGSPNAIAAFAKKHMPSFSKKLYSQADLDKFLSDDLIENKVILFTNKKETPYIYRALTSEYRDRLEFADVHESVEDVIKAYNIDKFPTILVLVRQADGTYEKEFYESDLKIEKLLRFLKRYARKEKVTRPIPEPEKKPEKPKEEKKPEKPVIKPSVLTHDSYDKIYNHERLVLVHLFKDEEHPAFNETFKKFHSIVDFYNLNCSTPEAEAFCTGTVGIRSFPAFRVHGIGLEDKKKKNKITLSKNFELEEISKEISDLVEDITTPLNSQEIGGFISTALSAKKPALIMFYTKDELSLSFKALVQLEKYRESIVFGSFKNPPEQVISQFGLKTVPVLAAVFLRDPESETVDLQNNVQVGQFTGRYVYSELSGFIDMFLPPEERVAVKPESVPEITNAQDFDSKCIKKGLICVIGLLNGYKDTPESEAKLKENIEVLEKARLRYSNRELTFMWVDAVCHSELLIGLDLQVEMVPTLVTYNPSKKTFSQIIGVLNRESIVFYLDQVLRNKISPFPVRDQLKIDTKDCAAVHKSIIELEQQANEKSSEEDEILKEILEEENRRRQKMEEEEEENKSKDKKKKKGKKKKGKKAPKDEL